MSAPLTSLRPTVRQHGSARPSIVLLLTDLEKVQATLDAHQVRYEVDEDAYSVDDGPEVTFITLNRGTDPDAVQKYLDAIS